MKDERQNNSRCKKPTTMHSTAGILSIIDPAGESMPRMVDMAAFLKTMSIVPRLVGPRLIGIPPRPNFGSWPDQVSGYNTAFVLVWKAIIIIALVFWEPTLPTLLIRETMDQWGNNETGDRWDGDPMRQMTNKTGTSETGDQWDGESNETGTVRLRT